MRSVTRTFFWILGAVVSTTMARADYFLTISSSRLFVPVHDNITISANLVNNSDEASISDFGDNADDYMIDVRDAAGDRVPESSYSRRRRLSVPVRSAERHIRISPHESITVQIDVAQYFDFPDSPGRYTIQLSRRGMASNKLLITVVPTSVGPEESLEGTGLQLPALAGSGTAQQDFSLQIEVDRPVVSAGEAIPVYAFLVNRSSRSIAVSVPNSRDSNYAIEIRNAQGNAVHETPAAAERRAAAVRYPGHILPIEILPGARVAGQVEIDKYVDLSSPGVYFIQLRWDVPEALGGGAVRSNLLRLLIRHRAQQ